MISSLTRRAKETASLNVLRWDSKTIRIRPGCGVMSHYGVRQQIRFMEILFSLRWYVEFVLQSRTLALCSKSSMKYSEEEPALQCRRQTALRTHRH